MKKEEEKVEWDKKRILLAACVVIAALVAAAELKSRFSSNKSFLGQPSINKSTIEKPNVERPSLNVASEVGSKIAEIKQNINGLDGAEVATSSPQIQKVLQDIQGIKDLPTSQAKEMCLKVCSGI